MNRNTGYGHAGLRRRVEVDARRRSTRRAFLLALGAGALAAPFAPIAQQLPAKIARIGFLSPSSAAGYVKETDAIRARLRDLGYVDGRNIVIEYRWAENNPDRFREMLAELVALKVDAIITHSTPAVRAAAQATKTIPIVVADATDPVVAGLVASLARPGGNVTGSTSFQPEISTTRLELLTEVAPRIKRVAVLLYARSGNNEVYLRQMEPAAKKLQVALHQFAVNGVEELPDAFSAMAKNRIEAVVIGEIPLLNSNAGAIAALAVSHRLPASGFTNFADAGGLLGYGANRALVYGRAANFVDKILKGANPGDLPIERATKFDLIINMKTAKALGVKIPNSVLVRAERVIE